MFFAPNDNPTPSPQTDNFCFQCHDTDSSVQAVTNYSYSDTFGGGSSTTPDDIKDAFNLTGDYASSHNLSDVLSHAVGRGIGFTSDMNPCFVCHDHHLAQRNFPVTLSGLGGVKTAIRRPGDLANPPTPTNLWGDEGNATPAERMKDYTNKYQAPYYKGGSNYEPANDETYDGSNLPQFKNFCTTQCHVRTNVYSTERGANLREIDWTSPYGEYHGKSHSPSYNDPGGGYTIAPYTKSETYNYVLACTDCHEPHGSSNKWLLRTCVNGKDNIVVTDDTDSWYAFCTACHVLTWAIDTFHKEPPNAAPACGTCHYHGFPEGF
jgi:nitrate reductase cytochrome c-type subunit